MDRLTTTTTTNMTQTTKSVKHEHAFTRSKPTASAEKLAEALRFAFAQSCNRSETNRKWTNMDQVAHDKMKSALAEYEGSK